VAGFLLKDGAAGERTVAVAAGNAGGQALALGLVDEVAMDVVPVVFGSGQALLRDGRDRAPARGSHTVIQGGRVLHLRYRIRR
jgi:hypothetical protein